jgi:glycosyltransferase involved in cell wall biosynthesis
VAVSSQFSKSDVSRNKLVVCHLTTAHLASDVRIFERECKSIAEKANYSVILAAHGEMPNYDEVTHFTLGKIPKKRLFRLARSQIVSVWCLMRLKVDVWHLHDPELLIFARLLILLKKKVIWDAHEDYFMQFKNPQEHRVYVPRNLRTLLGAFLQNALSYVDKNALAVICATQSISDSYNNKNRVVVGNEARLEEFQECFPKFSSNRVLFTGATNEAQCFQQVVDAIGLSNHLVLTVAGRAPKPQDWRYAKDLLGERFEYLGWLNRSELSEAITRSKIGLITYNNQDTNMTNSPNKRFEFSASGLPCVVTPTPSNIDWARASSGAIVARDFTAAGLAEAIGTLSESEHIWSKISQSSRKWCEEFGSWETSEKRLLDVYKTIENEESSIK